MYWEPETKLLDEKRPGYFPHVFSGNSWLAAVQQNRKEFDSALYNSGLACRHIIERGVNVFPLLLREETNGHTLFGDNAGRKCHQFGDHCAIISDGALDYLNLHGGIESVADFFFHAISIMHSPSYAVENGDALRQDWPRIRLSSAAEQLRISGTLGKKLSALLDPESPVLGVTTGKRPPEIKSIALMTNLNGGQLAESDLAVAARWGVSGQGGACMPGPGKAVERAYTPDECAALGDGLAHLGEKTFDVYLNDRAYWQNVPA